MNIGIEQEDDGTSRLVLVCSSSDARLELHQPDDVGRDVDSYRVRLSVAGLQAETRVYFYSHDGLPQYVSGLASDWRGWAGRREWSSLEGQLTLDAEHDGLGTVQVVAALTPDAAFSRWRASAVLRLDAGGLESAAVTVDRFFAASA